MFNLFKHKKKDTSRTFEGRIITDEELEEMIKPKEESFIKKELREINSMVEEIKKQVE